MTTKAPRSGYDTCGRLYYFARMLDKVRLFAAGELREDYHANLGQGADGFMCGFLHVDYEPLRKRVLEGGTDKEILQWCQTSGRKLNGTDVLVWNHFISKLGWNDQATERLEHYKAEGGLELRKDVVTMLHCMDADEGREPPFVARPVTWDRVTAGYDAEMRPLFEAFSQRALEIAKVREGMHVADIAAGPGTLVALAARLGAKVSAIDFSPAMIAILKRRIAAEGWDGCDARTGNGMALPFGDGSSDAAFSMFGLIFFTDRAKGFAEMHRVLKPGGTAVISSWVPMSQLPQFAATMGTMCELLPDILPPRPPPPMLNDAESCRTEMSAGGFADVQVEEMTVPFTLGSVDELVDHLLRTNVVVTHVAASAGARWPAVERTLRERLAGHFGAGPQTIAMKALITSGRR